MSSRVSVTARAHQPIVSFLKQNTQTDKRRVGRRSVSSSSRDPWIPTICRGSRRVRQGSAEEQPGALWASQEQTDGHSHQRSGGNLEGIWGYRRCLHLQPVQCQCLLWHDIFQQCNINLQNRKTNCPRFTPRHCSSISICNVLRHYCAAFRCVIRFKACYLSKYS